MSDFEKKPDDEIEEPNGRAFGKYRIINDDEMPRLHGESTLKKQAEQPPMGIEREVTVLERRKAQRVQEEPERRRRMSEAPERRGRMSEAPAQPDEPRKPPRDSTGTKHRRKELSVSADLDGPESASRGPAKPADGRKKTRDSVARKGSCPSWLKSRVYKGGRPGKDENGLLELQELVIRHSPVGTAVLDNRGRIRIRNESFMESLGLDAEDAVEDIEEFSSRIEGVDLSGGFWDSIETGSTVEVEEEVVIGGETKTTIHVAFSPVSLPSGVSWCICYLETTSRSASRGGLLEYQNYVANLATSSADAIVGLDDDGSIKYWNQGAQALFGYTDDEIVGKSAMILVPGELKREAQLVLKVVREKGLYRNFDTHRIGKGGERIPVTMTVSAVRDENGKFIGTAATCQDLRASKDLHEKAMEAEKLNAVLQMAVSVYHKINNPLCVIAANAQLLLPKLAREKSEDAHRIESILDATKRISAVLEDLTRLTGVEPRMASTDKEDQTAA